MDGGGHEAGVDGHKCIKVFQLSAFLGKIRRERGKKEGEKEREGKG